MQQIDVNRYKWRNNVYNRGDNNTWVVETKKGTLTVTTALHHLLDMEYKQLNPDS